MGLDRLSAASSLGGRTRGGDVADAELDLHHGREEPPPLRRIEALDGAEDERPRERGVPLRQAEQRQAGLRFVARRAGAFVRRLRRRPFAAHSMHLAMLVPGAPDPLGIAARRPLLRLLRRRERIVPRAVQQEQRRPMRMALPGEAHHVGPFSAPVVEGARPLPGAPDVERRPARLQHRAVDDARRDRRDLAGRHGHHDLVELRQARVRFTEHDLRLAEPELGERDEVGVVGVPGESRRVFECRRRTFTVSGVERGEPLGDEQEPVVRSAVGVLLHEALRAREPPAAAGAVPEPHQLHPQPGGAPSGRIDVPVGEVGLMGARQRVEALLEAAEQDGGDGEVLEVGCRDGVLAIGLVETGDGVGEAVLPIRDAPPIEGGRRGHDASRS